MHVRLCGGGGRCNWIETGIRLSAEISRKQLQLQQQQQQQEQIQ